MKIMVYESETIAGVVSELISTLDRDFPANHSSGISTSIQRTLTDILKKASDDVSNLSKNYEYYSFVHQIIQDPLLLKILRLQWSQINVTDLEGTIVLIF